LPNLDFPFGNTDLRYQMHEQNQTINSSLPSLPVKERTRVYGLTKETMPVPHMAKWQKNDNLQILQQCLQVKHETRACCTSSSADNMFRVAARDLRSCGVCNYTLVGA
jgi:hypothetical protein